MMTPWKYSKYVPIKLEVKECMKAKLSGIMQSGRTTYHSLHMGSLWEHSCLSQFEILQDMLQQHMHSGMGIYLGRRSQLEKEWNI